MVAILYAQRQLRLHTSWTPQQVLTQRIPGTYTTALVTPRFEVVDWGLHKERLMRYDAVHGRRSAVGLSRSHHGRCNSTWTNLRRTAVRLLVWLPARPLASPGHGRDSLGSID